MAAPVTRQLTKICASRRHLRRTAQAALGRSDLPRDPFSCRGLRLASAGRALCDAYRSRDRNESQRDSGKGNQEF